MFRDSENILQRVQMKVHPPKIMSCILLMTMTLAWWHRLVKGLFSRPLGVLHAFEPIEKQIAPKTQKVWDKAGCFFSIHSHGPYM